MRNIIKKLNQAAVKIASVDMTAISEEDAKSLNELSLCCTYHVGVVTDIVNLAKQKIPLSDDVVASALTHAESFADQVIPGLNDFIKRSRL